MFSRWKGSVYKVIWFEFIIFSVLYTIISLIYRLALSADAKVFVQFKDSNFVFILEHLSTFVFGANMLVDYFPLALCWASTSTPLLSVGGNSFAPFPGPIHLLFLLMPMLRPQLKEPGCKDVPLSVISILPSVWRRVTYLRELGWDFLH